MFWNKPVTFFQNPTALPDITLSAPRILLRPARIEDWPAWAKTRKANQAHIQPFEPTWGKNCFEEDFFTRRLKRQAREWHLGNAQPFLIFTADGQTLIGGMNINNICRGAAQFCSLGYWIAAEYEGQGLMKEALVRTAQYCFEELELHRINCSTLLENTRSQNLLLSAGFVEEGRAKHYLKINGAWRDHILYGLPKETWITRISEFQSSPMQSRKTPTP